MVCAGRAQGRALPDRALRRRGRGRPRLRPTGGRAVRRVRLSEFPRGLVAREEAGRLRQKGKGDRPARPESGKDPPARSQTPPRQRADAPKGKGQEGKGAPRKRAKGKRTKERDSPEGQKEDDQRHTAAQVVGTTGRSDSDALFLRFSLLQKSNGPLDTSFHYRLFCRHMFKMCKTTRALPPGPRHFPLFANSMAGESGAPCLS